jgi:hypothetical protein
VQVIGRFRCGDVGEVEPRYICHHRCSLCVAVRLVVW